MSLIPILPNDAAIIVEIGKVPSLNSFYASKHWAIRKKAKDTFKAEILEQLNEMDKIQFQKIHIKAEVNYRYDLDNSIMAVKFALDAFKEWGGIPDDTKEHFGQLTLIYNSDLPKDQARISFIPKK